MYLLKFCLADVPLWFCAVTRDAWDVPSPWLVFFNTAILLLVPEQISVAEVGRMAKLMMGSADVKVASPNKVTIAQVINPEYRPEVEIKLTRESYFLIGCSSTS